jgi:predicted acylesterase/phospholipase RssA
MMIGAGGAVDAAHRRGALVLTPTAMGVGLLEFHQFDRMVQAGREAARALLADGFLSDRMTASEPLPRPEEPASEPPAVSAEGAVAPA